MVSANPTGPVTVASARNGAYGDSVARLLAFAGHDVEREYYYNDAGAQMERFRASVDAVRRGEEPPEDGYHGDYVARARDGRRRSGRARCCGGSRRRSTRFRVHFDSWTRETRGRGRDPRARSRCSTRIEDDGAVWARTSAHGDDKDRVLVRSDGRADVLREDAAYMRRSSRAGFDRLVYVLGADHHGYVAPAAGPRRDARACPASRSRCSSTSSSTSSRAARRRRCRSGAATSSSSTSCIDAIGVDAARWYLVARGHDQTIGPDVDLARSGRTRTPSTTSSTRTRGSRGSCATPTERSATPRAPTAARRRGARAREAARSSSRRSSAEATERRAPHAIPIYAIRVADDFHRFYHEHRVLESEQEAFRLALCRRDAGVIARCLDLIGVEAPERM